MIRDSIKTILNILKNKNRSDILYENYLFRITISSNWCIRSKYDAILCITRNWKNFNWKEDSPDNGKISINSCINNNIVLKNDKILHIVEKLKNGNVIINKESSVEDFFRKLERIFDVEEIEIILQQYIIDYI